MATTSQRFEPSPDRISEFREDFLRGRRAFGALEKVFRYFGAFEYKPDPNSTHAFGFDSLMDAGPWLANSAWGPAPAWDLAIAQERFLLARFEQHLVEAVGTTGQADTAPIQPTAQQIVGGAERLSSLLAARGCTPQLVVIASDLSVDTLVGFNSLFASPFWKLPSDLQANWILGADNGKLFLFWPEAQARWIYVVDVVEFGRLIQLGGEVDLTVTPVRSKVRVRLSESYKFEVHAPKSVWGAPLATVG